MIRQAISCDVCGAEKKQTNHWYVACEQGGEMRLGGWNSRMRQRPGAKHLCGQTCLHKLMDEFMARFNGARGGSAGTDSPETALPRSEVDASLTSPAAHEEVEPSALIIPSAASAPAAARPSITAPASSIFPMQPRLVSEHALTAPIPPQIEETPNYSSRRLRAEAWERERRRHPEPARRHKGI